MPMRKATVPGGASAVIRPASAALLIVVLLSVARRTDWGVPHDVDTGNMYTTARVVDTVNMLEGPGAARRYHHGNLRAALIDTAVEQARAGGAAAVVRRAAARRTGVSHNAAYRHFADRDDL